MAPVESIALTAACLTAGMRDFCDFNTYGIAYEGDEGLLERWGAGCQELHLELVRYAPLVVELEIQLYSLLRHGFNGMWSYEVTEALGCAIAEFIALQHCAPPAQWVKDQLAVLAGVFMRQGSYSNWPAIHARLLSLSPSFVLPPQAA